MSVLWLALLLASDARNDRGVSSPTVHGARVIAYQTQPMLDRERALEVAPVLQGDSTHAARCYEPNGALKYRGAIGACGPLR